MYLIIPMKDYLYLINLLYRYNSIQEELKDQGVLFYISSSSLILLIVLKAIHHGLKLAVLPILIDMFFAGFWKKNMALFSLFFRFLNLTIKAFFKCYAKTRNYYWRFISITKSPCPGGNGRNLYSRTMCTLPK